MKTCWGSSLDYNTHTTKMMPTIKYAGRWYCWHCGQKRSDNLFRRYSKTFPFILSYDARRPFPPNKALASRLDEKKKQRKKSNEKQYWFNINGLQWFHEHIHCIFMQLRVARHNKLAKTPEGNKTYAPAIRSFAFFIRQNESTRFLLLSWWFFECFVCFPPSTVLAAAFLAWSSVSRSSTPPEYHNWRCTSKGF